MRDGARLNAGRDTIEPDALTPDVPNDGKAFFGRDSIANYMVIGAKQLGHEFAKVGDDGKVTVEADKDT